MTPRPAEVLPSEDLIVPDLVDEVPSLLELCKNHLTQPNPKQ